MVLNTDAISPVHHKENTTINLGFQSEHFCLLYFHVTAKYKPTLSCFIREKIIGEKIFPKLIPAMVTITNTLITFYLEKEQWHI